MLKNITIKFSNTYPQSFFIQQIQQKIFRKFSLQSARFISFLLSKKKSCCQLSVIDKENFPTSNNLIKKGKKRKGIPENYFFVFQPNLMVSYQTKETRKIHRTVLNENIRIRKSLALDKSPTSAQALDTRIASIFRFLFSGLYYIVYVF